MNDHTHSPKISVIIPNLHSPMLDQTVQSLIDQQTTRDFEIIVVGMDKFDLLDQFGERVTFLETDQPTPPAIARNRGVSAGSGDLILLIDADCIASPDWIEKHVRAHQQADEPVVIGGGVTFPKDHYLTLSDNVSTFHEFMCHMPREKKDFLPSLNLSIPRLIWDAVSGFDETFPYPAGEDTDFTVRIIQHSFNLSFEPEATIVHLPQRHRLSDLITHAYRFGKYSVKANPSYRDVFDNALPLRHWLLTLITSPLLAAMVILKMIFSEKLPLKYWHTLPVIFFLKICWALGYSQQLRTRTGKAKQ